MDPERRIFVPTSPCPLPPLILHPLAGASEPERLALSARASLVLQGLLPGDGATSDAEWVRRLLDGRYCEVRMLFYIGKDLNRWLDQCLEVASRCPELQQAGLQRESFASLLVDDPPAKVREKLCQWGVFDYPAIFRRALALSVIFAELPRPELLSVEFIRSHHRYADAVFNALISAVPFPCLRAEDFPFELYASGEYARLLERQWEPT